MKKVEDHPIEDFYGDEILTGDVYFKFYSHVVLEENLKRYLIDFKIECYIAQ